MKSRKREFQVPSYYRAPMWPSRFMEPVEHIWQEYCDVWITASEWIAWLRRHKKPEYEKVYGRSTGGKWVYRARPMIESSFYLCSTRKERRLP